MARVVADLLGFAVHSRYLQFGLPIFKVSGCLVVALFPAVFAHCCAV